MRTLVISDLHLGARSGVDLLRRKELREILLAELEHVERLVILGDALELRESPIREVVGVTADFFRDVGRAMGPDKEIIVIVGNHDHGLIAGWIDVRLQTESPGFLEFEQIIEPHTMNGIAVQLAELAQPAKLRFAYPGLWLRDDVYAFHGHYSDVHTTVPTFERIAAGAMARWAVHLPEHNATCDDYESVLSPMYAWIHTYVQRSEHKLLSSGASASARAWVAMAGIGRRRRPVRAAFLGLGFAGIVACLNNIGLGPVTTQLSSGALLKGGLVGMHEVLSRLGLNPPHVIFGHTHRSGPWPNDPLDDWIMSSGTHLTNTGSWVFQPHFLSAQTSQSAYWPGTAVIVDETGPPQLKHLLADFSLQGLSPYADTRQRPGVS